MKNKLLIPWIIGCDPVGMALHPKQNILYSWRRTKFTIFSSFGKTLIDGF
jgi:hypothetical protein